MPILNNKALGLIDEKIKQFQRILDTATYDTRYNTEYHEAYYGTEDLVAELFSKEERNKFRLCVSTVGLVASTHIDYEEELKDYKTHINNCVSQLKVYKERIEKFWEESESIEYAVNKTTNPEVKPKADVLLVTATKTESRAIIDVFQDVTSQTTQLVRIGAQVYHNIGSVNGTRVFMVQSEMGSGGLGASQQTVQKGIIDLSPNAVIMVGIAFGIDSVKLDIGDVLVSRQLMPYEFLRVGTTDGKPQIIPRGDRAHASTRLLNYFRSVDVHWDESKCKVSFGLILSGEKLVDNIDFRQQLCDLDPEAIGGEMEGSGMYVACHDNKVDWILVKAICDWADGKKKENKEVQQKLAAKNAASFVLHMLQLVPFTEKSQVRESVYGIEPLLTERTLIESNQGSVVRELRKITTKSQSHKIHETFTNPFTGMEFVLIPAGEFKMGSTLNPLKGMFSSESPAHEVTIEYNFYLGKFPVTQRQWVAVMGENPSHFKDNNRPIENISWDEIREFIKKLNEMEGTDKYRLPSEAEWEYACRAGTQTKYFFGNDESKLKEYVWYTKNSGRETHPVGKRKSNHWGLYDMNGNVWERVLDTWYGTYTGAPSDGSARENGDTSCQPMRGGAWSAPAGYCRSATRLIIKSKSRGSHIGFRLLREL
jgi:Uncharacterized conserved protein